MTAKVPIKERGTAILGIIVPAAVRKNTKITPTTSAIQSTSSNSTSLTDALTVVVLSVRTVI